MSFGDLSHWLSSFDRSLFLSLSLSFATSTSTLTTTTTLRMAFSTLQAPCVKWSLRTLQLTCMPVVSTRILAMSSRKCQHALFSSVRSDKPGRRSDKPERRPKTFDSTSHRNKPAVTHSHLDGIAVPDLDRTTPVRDWNKKNLIGLSRQQLKDELGSVPGIKSYTADQIWRFLYQRGVTTIDDMLNIPSGIKDELKTKYTIDYGRVVVSHWRTALSVWAVG